MFVRSSGWLNWRLFRNPRAQYKVFGAWENGDLVCYAAYQSTLRPDGLRTVSLVDWLVDRALWARRLQGAGARDRHAAPGGKRPTSSP